MSLPDQPALMRALAATWPAAEEDRYGHWSARRGAGGGARVSAMTADPGAALDGDFEAACARTRGWGQTPLVQLGPERADLDAALQGRGWTVEDETLLFAAPVSAQAGRLGRNWMAARIRAPLAALDGLWTAGGVDAARQAVMARAPAPREKILVRARERPAAAVFVAAYGRIAMVHALHVAPQFRRGGAGRAAMAAAADWAAEEGAETLALAVRADNDPAIHLYKALAFAAAGRYAYRRAPLSPGQPSR